MRILVTGGSGFIGRRVVDLLRERHIDVVVIGRDERADVMADLLASDLSTIVARIAPTHVLHLAWTTAHPLYWTDPANVDWLAASALFMRSAYDAGVKRFVAAGTCAEYAWPCAACCESKTELAPSTLYAVAKDAFRRIGEAYARERGAQFAWGRTFFAYGPGEPAKKLISGVLTEVRAGHMPVIRDMRRHLDFVYVDDVARGFADLVMCDGATGAYNFGSGVLHSVSEAVRIALTLFGKSNLQLSDQLGSEIAVGADITRSRLVLGYEPMFSLADGIELTASAIAT